jgi:hypothetical protein
VEYQLSQDGRYKLKSLNKYQVRCQVIENGNCIYFNVDYNKFRELFKKAKLSKKKKTKKKQISPTIMKSKVKFLIYHLVY